MPTPSEVPIQFVKGVGPAKAKLLSQLGIHNVDDLLHLFPRRYDDRTTFKSINKLELGKWQSVCAEIIVGGERKSYFSQKARCEIIVGDETGRISCVWFNQPYLKNIFKVGTPIVLYGKLDVYKNKMQFVAPEFELISKDEQSLNMGRIVPIYPLTTGIGQKYLRKIIALCLDQHASQLTDVLPARIKQRFGFESIDKTIHQIHFPETLQDQQKSQDRAAFEEFFTFQISVILRRHCLAQKKGIAHEITKDFVQKFSASIPYALTKPQISCFNEILEDMRLIKPMHRLLQGDVGSGKTILAFGACLAAIINKHQAAVMAPTEILIQQHFENFQKIFSSTLGKSVRTALLMSSTPKKAKALILKELAEGNIDIIFGTHALIEDNVIFKDLSLIVIDEQHKFGVRQRALLTAKSENPDVLVLTATPIPRSLCLTLYGDLDVSTIDELPPGRGQIKTFHYPKNKDSFVYQKVRLLVEKGTQAYIVYPIIEESEKLDIKAATDMYEHLRSHEFKGLRLALVHGQMDRKEISLIMNDFKAHKIDVLVSTTILEVGIDVANANVMVIEHPERFGLSQLHQMRGRIGRSEKNAVCILLGDATTDEAKLRIDAILETRDGFKIAQRDLEIRGPGQYFGGQQHGVNELQIANPITQMKVLEHAREEAIALLKEDPKLTQQVHHQIKERIRKQYPHYLDMLLAG